MIKLLLLFFLTIPLSNSKAIGGLEVPDIGIGDLLERSTKEEENSKKSSPAGGAIGLIKTLTDEETIEEELEAGKNMLVNY